MDYVPGIVLTVLDDQDREAASIRGWTQCSWSRRVDRLPSAGAFALAPHTLPEVRDIAAALIQYRKVRLMVDGITRGTGYVARTKKRGARDATGPVLTVEVEGLLGPALASSIPEDFAPGENQTIRSIAEDILWPWGIEVVAGADADRVAVERHMVTGEKAWGMMSAAEQAAYLAQHQDLARLQSAANQSVDKIKQDLIDWFKANPDLAVKRLVETRESRALHPHPDELIGSFLPRLLKGYGLILLEGADGSAILTTPDYTVRADRPRIEKRMTGGTIHEGTIIDSDLEQTFARVGEFNVRGCRRKVGREVESSSATAQDAELVASFWRSLRTVRVTDPTIRDGAEAQRRADTMLRESQFSGYSYSASLAGYAVGPKVISRDQVIAVLDEEHEVDADLYVIGDEIGFSDKGPSLKVECTLPGTWTGA